MEIIVNYLKYELCRDYESHSDYAKLIGYDKRKIISSVRIPQSIQYNNKEYPVLGMPYFNCFSEKLVYMEIPNTIIYRGDQKVDFTPYTNKEDVLPEGLKVKIYEARKNPPKKCWWKRIFG